MPYYYGYGFDWTYIVLVLPCILLSLWASSNVKSTFNKYSKQYSSRRLTGSNYKIDSGFICALNYNFTVHTAVPRRSAALPR